MDYIVKKSLGKYESNSISKLYSDCCVTCDFPIMNFMENNMNFDEEFPAFYVAYNNDCHTIPIGFLSAFSCDGDECELYAYVHPDYRQKGIFTSLYSAFLDTDDLYEFDSLLFPVSPDNQLAKHILTKLGYNFYVSEYTLIYDSATHVSGIKKNSDGKIANSLLSVSCQAVSDDVATTLEYKLSLLADPDAGSCYVYIYGHSCTIYSLEISDKYRGRGYGSFMLDYIIDYLSENYPENNIILQVHGDNKKAVTLYDRHGFSIKEQIDYYNLF